MKLLNPEAPQSFKIASFSIPVWLLESLRSHLRCVGKPTPADLVGLAVLKAIEEVHQRRN